MHALCELFKRWSALLLISLVLAIGLILAAFFFLLPSYIQTPSQASYSILTTWNGDEVRHDPASVTLGSTDSGDLTIHIQASLVGDLEFPPNCNPGRPYPGLWNYEVVEAFFLDPVSVSYVELEFHPCGAHLALLLHPERVDLVNYLPLQYEATIQGDRWEGFAIVPSAYLPANVSSFNMFAIHKATLIEEDQAWEDGKIYEALFPVEEGSQPDFHNLGVFQPIDLAKLGVTVSNSPSQIWTSALAGKKFSGLL